MAYLTSLALFQFRSHRKTSLELDGRPIAISGPNGAGKTNILEAVSLLSPGRGLRRASAPDIARRPEGIGWKISATLPNGSEIETASEPGQPRTVRIDGKAVAQTVLATRVRILWLVPAMDRLWTEAAEGRRRFLDRMTMSLFPEHAEVSLVYEKSMRERNRLLKDEVSDPAWYRALEARMAEAGASIDAGRREALKRIRTAGRASTSIFPTAELDLLGPDGVPAEIFEEEALSQSFAEGRRRDMAAGRTLTGPHRADLGATWASKGIAAREGSTGEQKALLISLVLANARALAAESGVPPIILLDEVAAHLDSGRRAALYDEVCALSAQAWMTGTGAELFTDLGTRADHLSVFESDGLSKVTRQD